ncbi:PST family polysaccharide transporter/antigen flippase [Sphaerotilus hippei]|uniref:PST family polysaccharide transporter/antigen flippase n=2 Tax=Sphaerotilus hippei TaxID=744406 RepID=A0A318H1S5_9BURK|nr:PST family polysaccharide transporter/antigen flippase [Sphaerotilus hippei]
MSLLKASAVSAIGAGIKLLFGLLLIKVVANSLGPSGLGLMGQLMSMTTILVLLAGGGIATGVVKYVAEYREAPVRLHEFLSAARGYSLIASLILLIVGLLVAQPLALWIFKEPGYGYIVYILSFAQLGIAINTFALAVVGGYKDVVTSNVVSTVGSLLGVLALVLLIYCFGNTGMLIGLTALPALPVLISLWIVRKKYPEVLRRRFWINKRDTRLLFRFSLMMAASAITMPVAQMLLRSHLVDQFGWTQVGYLQATIRLSDAYLLFVNMVLAGYYMPKLSELGPGRQQLRYMMDAMTRLLPLVAVCIAIIWLLGTPLISLLFSEEFLPARELLTYQLIGDFFKIGSFIMGYVVVANAWLRLSILGDIVQATLFFSLAWYQSSHYGMLGVSIGYAVCYIVYFAALSALFYRSWRIQINE